MSAKTIISLESTLQKYKYYNRITLAFILCLVMSNIAATKLVSIFGLTLPGGIIVFPLLYVLNDILTEVYGFRASRRVIWLALFCNLITTLVLYSVTLLPAAQPWSNEEAYSGVFSLTPRIFIASVSSYFIGELLNASTISVLKIQLEGKFFAFRAILSTCVGALIETAIFASIAFGHHLPFVELVSIIFTLTIVKVLYEFLVLPVSVKLAAFLKREEKIDIYEKPTLKGAFSFW